MFFAKKTGMRKCRESGQSMVEFAIVLPMLLLLVAASCDLCWIMLQRMQLNDMATTLASINQEFLDSPAERYMREYVAVNYPNIDASRMQISATTEATRDEYYEYIWQEHKNDGTFYRTEMFNTTLLTSVNLDYTVSFLTPMGKMLFGTDANEITLSAQADSFRVLQNEAR